METTNIPQELRDLNQWVNWSYGEERPSGKRAKPPMIPGSPIQAKINNPNHWTSFEIAHRHDSNHLGLVLVESDGLVGIDLDHCVKEDVIEPWAKQVIKDLNSYTEISPSGTGLHIFVWGLLRDLRGRKKDNIELYEMNRYLTVTGNHLEGTPFTIKSRQEPLEIFHRGVFGEQPPTNLDPPQTTAKDLEGSTPLMDDLWKGEWDSHFPSQNEADLSFVTRIGSKVGWDFDLIDRLFRSSGLMREKWERPDYRARTLAKARGAPPPSPTSHLRTWSLKEVRKFYGSVEWLWKGWIPRSHVTMVVGPQNVGKSFFAAYLIATLSGLRPWPDSSELDSTDQGPILLIETEGMRDAYGERLEKLGLNDTHSVHFVSGPEWWSTAQVDENFFVELAALAEETQAALIVVDSLSGIHTGSENDSTMRFLLQPFSQIAANLGIPVLIVHHVRKRRENESFRVTLDRVRGSSTITQFCRSVIGMWRFAKEDDEELPEARIEVIKSNFCAAPPPIGMKIQPVSAVPGFGPAPKAPKTTSAIDDAKEWLSDRLQGGSRLAASIFSEGASEGHSEITLKRAKKQLHLKVSRIGSSWHWELPTITIKRSGVVEF